MLLVIAALVHGNEGRKINSVSLHMYTFYIAAACVQIRYHAGRF